MTLSIQHPTAGSKALILRGIKHPTLGKKAIATVRITHPTLGDKVIWDNATSLPTLTVTVDHDFVQGAQATYATVPVVTSAAVVSASGGSAPYTYAWSLNSDDGGGTWTAQYPTAAGTTFRASTVIPSDTHTASFTCVVTDARGATGTVNVTASVTNYGKI